MPRCFQFFLSDIVGLLAHFTVHFSSSSKFCLLLLSLTLPFLFFSQKVHHGMSGGKPSPRFLHSSSSSFTPSLVRCLPTHMHESRLFLIVRASASSPILTVNLLPAACLPHPEPRRIFLSRPKKWRGAPNKIAHPTKGKSSWPVKEGSRPLKLFLPPSHSFPVFYAERKGSPKFAGT